MLRFQKWQAMPAKLSWSHYAELLSFKNIDEIKYYIYMIEKSNLSLRELREHIKSKEYERIFTTTYKLKGDDLIELL